MGCAPSRVARRLEKKAERAERRASELTEAAAAAAQLAQEKEDQSAARRNSRLKSRMKLRDATCETHAPWSLKGTSCAAKCLRVVDGDTVQLAIAEPLHGSLRVRLAGIDTEEMKQPTDMEGAERKARVALALRGRNALASMCSGRSIDEEESSRGEKFDNLLDGHTTVLWCEFAECDKYGRYLVTLRERRGAKQTLNERLVDMRLALPYDGGAKKDVWAELKAAPEAEGEGEEGDDASRA